MVKAFIDEKKIERIIMMKKSLKLVSFVLCLFIIAGVFSTVAVAHAASQIFCSECGKLIDASSKFCKYCGHKIGASSPTPTPRQTASPKGQDNSPYIIGTSENTFAGLYKRMCINLDLKKNPFPTPDEDLGPCGSETLFAKVLKDDSQTYEYVGYLRAKDGATKYLMWAWTGYHKDGDVIEMDVFYTPDGKYLGNIQRDRTAGTSTSSHRSPYYVPGEPLNKE